MGSKAVLQEAQVIKVQLDLAESLRLVSSVAEKQLPYAISLAINRVANKAQDAEREHMRQSFHLRRESFVLRGVKIAKADRATKTSWQCIIQLAYPDNRHFLDEHEEGQDRTRYGGKRLWQPNTQVFRSKIIGRANPLSPKRLGLHRDAGGRIVGNERTFLVRTRGQVLVLQRTDRGMDGRSRRGLKSMTLDNVHVGVGPKRKRDRAIHRTAGTRLLYRLVSRVRIPARLEFVKTIGDTVQREWMPTLSDAIADAARGAK
jgi:hypothetical protein